MSKKVISLVLSVAMIISCFACLPGLSVFAADDISVVDPSALEEAITAKREVVEAYPETYPEWHCDCGNIWADPSHNGDAEAPSDDLHYLWGEGNCKYEDGYGCDGTLHKWTEKNSWTASATGYYYLTANVTTTTSIGVGSTTAPTATTSTRNDLHIDLNGFNYTYTNTSGRMFTQLGRPDSHFSLTDTKGTSTVTAVNGTTQGFIVWPSTNNSSYATDTKLGTYSDANIYGGTYIVATTNYAAFGQASTRTSINVFDDVVIDCSAYTNSNTNSGRIFNLTGAESHLGFYGAILKGYSEVTGTTNAYGGAIYLGANATADIKGSLVEGGKTPGGGGNIGIAGADAVLNISDSIIRNGETSTDNYGKGGNIFCTAAATINIIDSVIEGGKSKDTGGNIYTSYATEFNIKGSIVRDGQTIGTSKLGGNIFVGANKVTVSASEKNQSVISGGITEYNTRNFGQITNGSIALNDSAAQIELKDATHADAVIIRRTGDKGVTLKDNAEIDVVYLESDTYACTEATNNVQAIDISESTAQSTNVYVWWATSYAFTERQSVVGEQPEGHELLFNPLYHLVYNGSTGLYDLATTGHVVTDAYPSTYPEWHCECGNIWLDPSHNSDVDPNLEELIANQDEENPDVHYLWGIDNCKIQGDYGCDGTLHKWTGVSSIANSTKAGYMYLTAGITNNTATTAMFAPNTTEGVHLDLNGKTINRSTADSNTTSTQRLATFRDNSNSSITITDTSEQGSGKVITNNMTGNQGGLVWFSQSAADKCKNNRFVLYGGEYTFTSTKGAYSQPGLFTQVTAADNEITLFDGVRIDASTMTSSATTDGGLIQIAASGSGTVLNIFGAKLYGLDHKGAGGVLHVQPETAKVTIKDAVISGGRTAKNGGNINVTAGTVDITNSVISDGVAEGTGGNINVASGASLTLNSTTVSGGVSNGAGGGNIAYGGNVDIIDSTITGGSTTTTSGKGGNINAIAGGGTLNITDSTVSNGYALDNGGNIYAANGTTINITGTKVVDGQVVGNSKVGGNIFLATATVNIGKSAKGESQVTGGISSFNTRNSGQITDNDIVINGNGNVYANDNTVIGSIFARNINEKAFTFKDNSTVSKVYIESSTYLADGTDSTGRQALDMSECKSEMTIEIYATVVALNTSAGTTAVGIERTGVADIPENVTLDIKTTDLTFIKNASTGLYDIVFATRTQCVCGGKGEDIEGHECEEVEFTLWADATSLPTSGYYFLVVDVDVAAATVLNGNLALDLNGHTVTKTAAVRLVEVPASYTFDLTDSAEGGAIDGANITTAVDGANIYVEGTLNMYAGTVKGGKTTGKGGNIYVADEAKANVNGTVTGGVAAENGGADIFVGYTKKAGATLTLNADANVGTVDAMYPYTTVTVVEGATADVNYLTFNATRTKVKSNDTLEEAYKNWYLLVRGQKKLDGTYDVNFYSLVDGNIENYTVAGFKVSINGGPEVDLATHSVYKSIFENHKEVMIGDYSLESDYYFHMNMTFADEIVKAPGSYITVTAYLVNADGETIQGETKTVSLAALFLN